jgi:hypothetical protein
MKTNISLAPDKKVACFPEVSSLPSQPMPFNLSIPKSLLEQDFILI